MAKTTKKVTTVKKEVTKKEPQNAAVFDGSMLLQNFNEMLSRVTKEAGMYYHKAVVRMCLVDAFGENEYVSLQGAEPSKERILNNFDEMTARLTTDEADADGNKILKKILSTDEINAIMASLLR